MPLQIQTDGALACVSIRILQIFRHYGIQKVTGIFNNPIGQTILERYIRVLKNKEK